MGSLHIDRLLEACIKMGGSDLHLTVGRPPVLRIHGRLRSLDTKVLGPEDTSALMKSVTPEKSAGTSGKRGSGFWLCIWRRRAIQNLNFPSERSYHYGTPTDSFDYIHLRGNRIA